jgi:hypothetical protein
VLWAARMWRAARVLRALWAARVLWTVWAARLGAVRLGLGRWVVGAVLRWGVPWLGGWGL